MDFFKFFSLSRKLNVDLSSLQKSFYAMSRSLHPDRFVSRLPAEQEAALRESSFLNDGYRTLKDPVLRTRYLLSLEGVELEEQSRAATDAARSSGVEKKQIIPPELLEEVFELNMQLAEMKASTQMGEVDPDLRRDLEVAKRSFEAKLAHSQTSLEKLWDTWDSAMDEDDTDLRDTTKAAMVVLLNKRSYISNLVRDVNTALGS